MSWLDGVPGALKVRRVGADGELGPVVEVASVSAQRNAGFPQMIPARDRLLFAWTDVDANRVRARLTPVP